MIFRFFEDPRHAKRDGTNCATPRFTAIAFEKAVKTYAKIINYSDYARSQKDQS
jgi:hypothetical protein